MTARWVVDIAPHRDLRVTWQPISLKMKNQATPEDRFWKGYRFAHGLLRVMEAVRVSAGDDGVDRLYTEYGRRIHHDGDRAFPAGDALRSVGLDPDLATAADDETWDPVIEAAMDRGLALVGDEVGTPIVAWAGADGRRVGIFGPVITRVPPPEAGLRLWDCTRELAELDGFWELKRTRTERPDVGTRP